jgi:hypothetical protein
MARGRWALQLPTIAKPSNFVLPATLAARGNGLSGPPNHYYSITINFSRPH